MERVDRVVFKWYVREVQLRYNSVEVCEVQLCKNRERYKVAKYNFVITGSEV